MSVWPSQPGRLSSRHGSATGIHSRLPTLRISPGRALALGCLVCVLIAQGVAITQSYLWAAPLICVLIIALAVDIPLIPFLGVTMLVRVLTDDVASGSSRHSSSLNLDGLIAGIYLVVAIGFLLHRRRGLMPACAIGMWLALWTAVAAGGHGGASTLTVREGVREASIVAVAIIAYNAPDVLNLTKVTRLVQIAGVASAALALYQLASHTGISVGGEIRSNGTFSQPNVAAVFFAVASMISVWRYVDYGRGLLDLSFAVVFAAATIATFSLGGVSCLLAMLIVFGLLRPGSLRLKLGGCAAAALVAIAFLATPLGAEHFNEESSTQISAKRINGEAKTSLGTRLEKWESLIVEWETSPIIGKGLGTTVTTEGVSENATSGLLPHNEYLRYLVETGVIGLIAALSGVYILLRRMARNRVMVANNAGTLGIALVSGLLVNAIAANTLLYTAAAYATALVIGAVLSASSAVPSPSRAV